MTVPPLGHGWRSWRWKAWFVWPGLWIVSAAYVEVVFLAAGLCFEKCLGCVQFYHQSPGGAHADENINCLSPHLLAFCLPGRTAILGGRYNVSAATTCHGVDNIS